LTVNYGVTGGTATGGGIDYTLTGGTLTFSAGETSATFDVPITDDAVFEGAETVNLTLSSPTNATLGSPATAVITISDNDIAGITVTPTSGLITTEAGGTATFTVVLNTQPSANVTIVLSSNDTSEGTVSPTSLTFTSANWNTPQTVTVNGVDDVLVDGNIAYTIVTAAAVSTDTNYHGFNVADANVTNNDNDGQSVLAIIRIEPETLNLASKGDFTVFITLPEGFNVADVLLDTVRCGGAPAIRSTVADDTMIVKFDRQSLTGTEVGDEVTLTVTGRLRSGALFSSRYTMRVINNK
jgi:hypothetical protein